jgi:hypothetical protein
MRKERINVFYYPEMVAAFATLKKAICYLMKSILWIGLPSLLAAALTV